MDKRGSPVAVRKGDADIDAVAVGREAYRELRERLEATASGSFVVIDARSGDYEVDPSSPSEKRR